MTILADKREVIDDVHRHIHLGDSFTAPWKSEDNAPVADNGIFGIVLLVGELPPQINFNVACGGTVDAILYEAPTLSVTGTPTPTYNLNRLSGKGSSIVQAWHSPTVTTGTALSVVVQPGGWTNSTPGGMARDETHWILRTGTFYFLGGINRAGSAQPASVTAQWYEEELRSDGNET